MSDETQCEKIADQYEKISKLYEPLQNTDLHSFLPMDAPPPTVAPYEVHNFIQQMKNTKATLPCDIPVSLIKKECTVSSPQQES